MNDNPDWLALEWHGECPDCERALQEMQQECREQIAQAAAKWKHESLEAFESRRRDMGFHSGYPCKCILIPVQSKRPSIWHRIWNLIRHI
jgi:hypothetical protein